MRKKYGWPIDKPLVLLVGGGDGMGPLEETAYAINQANIDVSMVIVAGRNEVIKKRLETHNWQSPTFIYGFVKEMPEFMQAVDILVTKSRAGDNQ